MKRGFLRKMAMIAMVSLLQSGCSDSTTGAGSRQEPVIWRFALEEISGSVQDAYAQEFRKHIHLASAGRIRVEVYPYGSIGASPQLTQLVREARVHLAFASPGHLAQIIPETDVFNLHFVLPDDDGEATRQLASPRLRALLEPAYQDKGLKLLDIINEGWMTWTANRPLHTPEDFSDLRLRTMMSPLIAEIFLAYGASPVPLPYSEVYAALQLNRIDGQTNPVFAVHEMKFAELQSDITLPRAARFITTLIGSHAWYSALSDEERQWLDQARVRLTGYIHEQQQQINHTRLDELKQSGKIRITRLTEAERERFRALSEPLRQRYTELTGETGRQLLEQLGSGQVNAD